MPNCSCNCDLCNPGPPLSTKVFRPETLCRYHRSQYDYALQQRKQEDGPEGVRFTGPTYRARGVRTKR